MNEEIRRMVAYTAAGRAKKTFASSIYSHDRGQHTHMSKNYDFESGNHFSGADSGNLYHFGRGSHVQMKVNEGRITGFDFDSGSHFQGRITGRSVQIYDFGEGRYYNYSV